MHDSKPRADNNNVCCILSIVWCTDSYADSDRRIFLWCKLCQYALSPCLWTNCGHISQCCVLQLNCVGGVCVRVRGAWGSEREGGAYVEWIWTPANRHLFLPGAPPSQSLCESSKLCIISRLHWPLLVSFPARMPLIFTALERGWKESIILMQIWLCCSLILAW